MEVHELVARALYGDMIILILSIIILTHLLLNKGQGA